MAKKKVFSIGSALSQGLEETIESAQHYSGDLRVDVIPIKKLELDPHNPRHLALTLTDVQFGIKESDNQKARKLNELHNLKSLADSIRTQGIINPITVYKHEEKYRLIAGERRTLASLLAGKADIQAKILDEKPSDLKISLLQWIENIERTDLFLWERLNNLEKILAAYAKSKKIEVHQVSVTQLSELIGCVKSHAINYKAVLEASAEIRELILQNKIKNLEKAALLANIKNDEIRQEAISACLMGGTLKKLKNIAEREKFKIVPVNKMEMRGRSTVVVNFGSTAHLPVAKMIIQSLVTSKQLPGMPDPKTIDWNNPRMLSQVFKTLLKTLEKIHS